MPDGTRELRLVVTVPDHDAAVRFYRDVLGLREEASFVDDNGGRATLLHAGRATLEVGDEAHAAAIDDLEVGRRVAGPLRLAFEVVGDAADAAERLVGAGARPVAPPVRTPWGSVNARLEGLGGEPLTVYANDVDLVERARLDGPVVLADPDPGWAIAAEEFLHDIRQALGAEALVAEHVGSTAVPGLPAKPVLDLVVGVREPADEATYVPALEALGYRLHIREPEWHEHRFLVRPDPVVQVHVFAAGSTEIDRMVAFRDHLRRDAGDRDLYLRTKRDLASRTWAYVQDYADAKSDVVEEILRRATAVGVQPLHGCVVLVTGPDAATEGPLARDLAARLGLPLLSYGRAREALGVGLVAYGVKGAASADKALVPVLLSLVVDLGGGVVDVPDVLDDRLVGGTGTARIVEVSRPGGRAAGGARAGWPVIALAAAEPVDIDALARQVRQAAAVS
ncbi:MAG TPA: GrpB family protein [Jiangellales bacterium]|nr:GrpB family protein [Jiangellales bacterium]